MAISPKGYIVKSPRCNQPPKYGLLSSIDSISPTDTHWMSSGITWEDNLCGPQVQTFIDECPAPTGFELPEDEFSSFCSADPFVAVGSYKCAPVGRPAGEAFDIARQRLLTWEGFQVENTLWTGDTETGTINPSFAYGNSDCDITPVDISPGGGAVDPVTAVALLEDRLGSLVSCGGTLHIPYGLMAYFKAHHLLVEDGDELYSPTGFKIIAGHGYPGTGPANIAASAGETWVFATGPLVVVKSNVIMVPDNIGQSVDRLINNVVVRAQRFFSVGFSCALLALKVNLSMECC